MLRFSIRFACRNIANMLSIRTNPVEDRKSPLLSILQCGIGRLLALNAVFVWSGPVKNRRTCTKSALKLRCCSSVIKLKLGENLQRFHKRLARLAQDERI